MKASEAESSANTALQPDGQKDEREKEFLNRIVLAPNKRSTVAFVSECLGEEQLQKGRVVGTEADWMMELSSGIDD